MEHVFENARLAPAVVLELDGDISPTRDFGSGISAISIHPTGISIHDENIERSCVVSLLHPELINYIFEHLKVFQW